MTKFEVYYCPCGLRANHKGKCLSIRTDKIKERIQKRPGFSKSFDGFQNIRKDKNE